MDGGRFAEYRSREALNRRTGIVDGIFRGVEVANLGGRSGEGDDAVLDAVEIDFENARGLFGFGLDGLLFGLLVSYLSILRVGIGGRGIGLLVFLARRFGLGGWRGHRRLFGLDLGFVAQGWEGGRFVRGEGDYVDAGCFRVRKFEVDIAEDFVEVAVREEVEVALAAVEDGRVAVIQW